MGSGVRSVGVDGDIHEWDAYHRQRLRPIGASTAR
jgi:hypothetical protein